MHCRIFGHRFEKFIQFEITPKIPNGVIDHEGCTDQQENYKKTITAFVCIKCGVSRNYAHNFTRDKGAKEC